MEHVIAQNLEKGIYTLQGSLNRPARITQYGCWSIDDLLLVLQSIQDLRDTVGKASRLTLVGRAVNSTSPSFCRFQTMFEAKAKPIETFANMEEQKVISLEIIKGRGQGHRRQIFGSR